MEQRPNAASVAIFDGEKVLLIQRARHPFRYHWTLPGGRLEPGESAEMAARREVSEELGLAPGPMLPVKQISIETYVLAIFATRFVPGIIVPSSEIVEWRWVPFDGLNIEPKTPDLALHVRDAHLLVHRGVNKSAF